MVVRDVQVSVLKTVVLEKSQRLFPEPTPIRIYTESMWPKCKGSWSRGYDVALTWQRSPVQFWPSPPPRIVVVDRIDQSESRRELAPILNRFEPASMIEGSWRWTRLVRRLTSSTVLMPPESFTPRLSPNARSWRITS